MMTDKLEEMLSGLNKKEPTRDEWATKEVNKKILSIRDTSQISDGSHTFEELYHHRAVLFATICNQFSDNGWKSKNHSNGDMIKNFFIVGMETPDGQFTYHYPMEYWKMFKVEVRDLAPEWDGHSSYDIERLFSLINKSEGNL